MVLDLFMALCAVIAAGLYVYLMLFGTFPFNAFLSAFYCSIGMFVLTGESCSCVSVALCLQASAPSPSGTQTLAQIVACLQWICSACKHYIT